jgi:hypothetical protein
VLDDYRGVARRIREMLLEHGSQKIEL